jgi:DNA-binding MarR family transcriptional regulator
MSDEILDVPMAAHPFMVAANVDADMTCRQMAVLLMMASYLGCSVKHIARALGLSKPVVTRAIDRLSLLGLASRTTSRHDRRQVELAPTRAGMALLRAAGLWPSA